MFHHFLAFKNILEMCKIGVQWNISKSIKHLFVFEYISGSYNFNVAIKYFAIFDENLATIFQSQRC